MSSKVVPQEYDYQLLSLSVQKAGWDRSFLVPKSPPQYREVSEDTREWRKI